MTITTPASAIRTGILLATAGAGLLLTALPVQAQTVSGVVVTAPRSIGRNAATGASIDLVTMETRVVYKDLDLKTVAGSKALDKRIADAARSACTSLENLYPVGSPDTVVCTKEAIKGAQAQVSQVKAVALR